MKRILCMLLAVCMVALLCTACGTETKVNEIPCPVPGLNWGMTYEEALSALQEKGLSKEELNLATPGLIQLSGKQAEKLGLQEVAGLPLNSKVAEGVCVISAGFKENTDGTQYLSYSMVQVETADNSEPEASLTEAYGEPIGSYWCSVPESLLLTKKQREKLNESELAALERQTTPYAAYRYYPYVCVVIKNQQSASLSYNAAEYLHLTKGYF